MTPTLSSFIRAESPPCSATWIPLQTTLTRSSARRVAALGLEHAFLKDDVPVKAALSRGDHCIGRVRTLIKRESLESSDVGELLARARGHDLAELVGNGSKTSCIADHLHDADRGIGERVEREHGQ